MKTLYTKDDIDKYATPEEKLFLEDFKGSWVNGEYIDPETVGNIEGKRWLQRQKLQKTLRGQPGALERDTLRSGAGRWDNSNGVNFTQPFDANGQPRKYLKILLALEAEPGLTKIEIYRDVLGRDMSPKQIQSTDTSSMWSGLRSAGLVTVQKDPGTGKFRYNVGPNWQKYKEEILGQ